MMDEHMSERRHAVLSIDPTRTPHLYGGSFTKAVVIMCASLYFQSLGTLCDTVYDSARQLST